MAHTIRYQESSPQYLWVEDQGLLQTWQGDYHGELRSPAWNCGRNESEVNYQHPVSGRSCYVMGRKYRWVQGRELNLWGKIFGPLNCEYPIGF